MVKPQDLGHLIDQHPFFAGLDAVSRAALVRGAANERFVAGEHLFRVGAEARKFYLIREGRAAVEVEPPMRPPIILETLSQGDVVGWSWLVPPYRTAFDVRAQTGMRVLSFDAACLRKAMAADPALCTAILSRFLPVIAHRLSAARMQMLDLYAPPRAPRDKAEQDGCGRTDKKDKKAGKARKEKKGKKGKTP